MSQSWPYSGARWWKFDFHTHTPASKDTGAWQAAIGTPNELTPTVKVKAVVRWIMQPPVRYRADWWPPEPRCHAPG